MKKILLFFVACFFTATVVNATTNTRNTYTPFIFIENNVEYAIFKNGDFDFNVLNTRNSRVSINTGVVNLSFNTGRNYSPYIETNRYGEISLINRTPIFYDYKGRVSRIGTVNINYNRFGLVSSIGSLNIIYNSNGVFNRSIGYINLRNRHYTPYSRSYVKPKIKNKVANKRGVYRANNTYYSNNNSRNYSSKNKVIVNNNYSTNSNKYKNKKSSKGNKIKNESTKKTSSSYEISYSKRSNSNSYRR